MTHDDAAGRPHLTAARIKANETYQRRRARTAADTLLEIRPDLWDDQTRRTLLVTLPSLAFARELARYGEPAAPPAAPPAADDPQPLQAAWCDYASSTGPCTLPEGHTGDHDPDPYAIEVDMRYALAADLERMGLWPDPPDDPGRSRMHDNGDYRA